MNHLSNKVSPANHVIIAMMAMLCYEKKRIRKN